MEFERVNTNLLNISQSSLDEYTDNISKNEYYEQKEDCEKRSQLEERFRDRFLETDQLRKLVTYQGNKNIPFLSIYRYKEAFSFQLVDLILRNFEEEDLTVFDPYSGMGTTLFASAVNEVEAYGIDKLPLAVHMSNSILDSVTVDTDQVSSEFERISKNLQNYEEAEIAEDVRVVGRVFPEDMLSDLKKWKKAISEIEDKKVNTTLNMIFLSSLIDCSYAKNSGQFLRTDKSQELADPENAMRQKNEIVSTLIKNRPGNEVERDNLTIWRSMQAGSTSGGSWRNAKGDMEE